jgi:hypothetical protein
MKSSDPKGSLRKSSNRLGGEIVFKLHFNLDELLNHPICTSIFVADLALLMFMPLIRPPIILSILLVGLLVYLSMFFGAKFGSIEGKSG